MILCSYLILLQIDDVQGYTLVRIGSRADTVGKKRQKVLQNGLVQKPESISKGVIYH